MENGVAVLTADSNLQMVLMLSIKILNNKRDIVTVTVERVQNSLYLYLPFSFCLIMIF